VRSSRRSGTRPILVWSTLGSAIFPVAVALTRDGRLITLFAGINGIFQAGINLVFFEELMKTVPAEYSSTFVALAQSLQFFSLVVAPFIATTIGDTLGLGVALIVGGAFQLIGFLMFALNWPADIVRVKAAASGE
jgi:hypothetical protein